MSDIHGMYDSYKRMLSKVGFSEDDTLYILGDTIDRGTEGLKILLDMSARSNVYHLVGNHEYVACAILPWLMQEITEQNTDENVLMDRLSIIEAWMKDGGNPTIEEFSKLSQEQREYVVDYINDMTVYEEVNVAGKNYLLTHAGLDNFQIGRAFDDYALGDFIYTSPKLSDQFFDDKLLIVGHTPTPYYYAQLNGTHQGEPKIFRTDSFIDIDCGCAYGGKLACLCLDTMEEFYV